MRVIVIEDNILFCDYICSYLQKAGWKTVKIHHLAQARKFMLSSMGEEDTLLADLRLPDGESTSLLEWMREQGYSQPFIIMTQYEDIHAAIHAMKLGAEDYILKPLIEDKLLPVMEKIRNRNLSFSKVIYERKSKAFNELYHYIRLVAPTDMSVLIWGETGTGKEHLAGNIHRQSLRANKPYVTVDCGMLPKELAASAFFGHVKGAFRGALKEKTGYFQEAHGGTLFIDEVENLPLEIQQMLLRVMEERRYRPIGGGQDRRSDVRIIAATNENLHEAVAEKRFRADLLYRLQDFTITVPALCRCPEDILPLADFFRRQYSEKWRLEVSDFDEPAKRMLLEHSWPGNVRELKQVVQAAVVLSEGQCISSRYLRITPTSGPERMMDGENSKKKMLSLLHEEESQAERVRQAIAESNGNLTQAAACF